MLNLNERSILFSLNGEVMMDPLGQEIAFKDIKPQDVILGCGEGAEGKVIAYLPHLIFSYFAYIVAKGFVPAFTLGSGQQVRINFGNAVQTLKYFTICGLQEGYSPFAVYVSTYCANTITV
ncbi:unnamed protein product [Rodentolepis nana]|uniref:SPRY domain-containing protein n=1 Tax=Rodentolepis nana TaxID=102285 RepID=A0A0R3U0B8_RODNA|nr:unnamed protein product [Rodentolepis nana]